MCYTTSVEEVYFTGVVKGGHSGCVSTTVVSDIVTVGGV